MNLKRPNIVFVLTDDQGYGDLGCHGNPYIKTPNIDKLYSESVHLTDFHVGPTCSPTRAGLYTGHYANSTGVWHTVGGRSLLREDEKTIAEIFQEEGYKTALFGKWHLGDNYPFRPQDRGFQKVLYHGGGGVGNTPDYWGNLYYDDYYCEDGEWKKFEGYCTDIWFSEAMKFIEQNKDNSFLCFINTNAPHRPLIVDKKYSDSYRHLAQTNGKAAEFFAYPESESIINFYGMISCIDENIGILRKKLNELGIAENTIFIFMTDNGSAGGLILDRDRFVIHGFNAGMRGGKATPYEGGHRVPFFLHWQAAGLNRSYDVNELTANIDILPTLMELCGIEVKEEYNFHGKSLVPLIKGEVKNWETRSIVTDSQRVANPIKWRLSCVMREKWRLINGHKLYNLESDPEQRNDISDKHPEIVQRLREDYEKWWEIVSSRFEEDVLIPISTDFESPVKLTCHDWRNDPVKEVGIEEYGGNTTALSNQVYVRNALERIGYWALDVQKEGTYSIEVRRWPQEANIGIKAGIPGKLKDTEDVIDGYGGGVALPIEKVKLRIGDFEAEKEVGNNDTKVVFEVFLNAGRTRLETLLTNSQGLALSAYYVYIGSSQSGKARLK